MALMHKLFFKSFTEEEYKQLVEIHKKETKTLIKRPRFMVGLLCLGGLMLYFLFKAFAPEQWHVSGKDLFSVAVGSVAAGTVLWFFLKAKINKGSRVFLMILLPCLFVIQLVIVLQKQKTLNIEYLVYLAVLLVGFISLNDSIREYFCERLLQEQKKQKN